MSQPTVLHEADVPLESWSEELAERLAWRTLFSGNRTPTEGLTAGIAELAPGASREVVTHRHPQVELYYVLSGEGVVLVGDVEHRVRAGSALFIPGNTEHASVNTGEETLRIFYVFATDSFEDVEYHFFPGTKRLGD